MIEAIPKSHADNRPLRPTSAPLDSVEVATRVGVAHLMATYHFLGDSGKLGELAGLFAPDGVMETNNARLVGYDAILGLFTETKKRFLAAGFLPARHHLSSVYVDVRSDGSASTYACFQFVGARGLDHWGTYRDEVVAMDGGWCFARRRVIVEGCVPESPVRPLVESGR